MKERFEQYENNKENKDLILDQLFQLSEQLNKIKKDGDFVRFTPDQDGYFKAGINFNKEINVLDHKYEKQLFESGLEINMYLGNRYSRRGEEDIDKNQYYGSVLFGIKDKNKFISFIDHVYRSKKTNSQVEFINYVLNDLCTGIKEQYSFTDDSLFELDDFYKDIKKRIQTGIDFENIFYVDDFVHDMDFVDQAMKKECLLDVSFALYRQLHNKEHNLSMYIRNHYKEEKNMTDIEKIFKEDLSFIKDLMKKDKGSFFVPQFITSFLSKRNQEKITLSLMLQDPNVDKNKLLNIKNIIDNSLKESNDLLDLYA